MSDIDLLRQAEQILERALTNRGDLAEIYLEERSATSIVFEENRVERIVSATEIGAGLRLLSGQQTLYAHSNDVSLNGLLKLAGTVGGRYRWTPCRAHVWLYSRVP